MKYTIYLEAKIVRDEDGEDVATLSRYYDGQTLTKIQQCVEHFGKTASVLTEGVEQGVVEPGATA